MSSEFVSFFSQILLIDYSLQLLGFFVGYLLQTEKFYDLTGSVSYVILFLFSFSKSSYHWRQIVLSLLGFIWAFRLGSFLFLRILKEGKDRRFDKVKTKPLLFFIFWMVQGVWVFLTALPIYVINFIENEPISTLDYIGWGIWFLGYIIESVADFQKFSFRSVSKNKEKFIKTGLWKYSRHPNYFGEIVLWWGIFISGCATFHGFQYLLIICPIFVAYLLIKVSGIPILERSSDKRWGSNPDYQEYKKRTSILIPMPPRS